jgi:hypothetical protein
MNERDKELAIQCKLITSNIKGIYVETLQEFADLIRADEREACAKVCESYLSESPHSWGGTTMAAAIRARGNT